MTHWPASVAARQRLEALATSLDVLTEEDLQLLVKAEASTVESWRKRGEGPAYVRAGNRFLYPRTAVAEWLAGRVRDRNATSGKGQL